MKHSPCPAEKLGLCGWVWAAILLSISLPCSRADLVYGELIAGVWTGTHPCPVPAQPCEASVSAVAFSLWVSFCFRELWRGFLFLPVATAETHPPSSQFLFHLIITFYYLQSP